MKMGCGIFDSGSPHRPDPLAALNALAVLDIDLVEMHRARDEAIGRIGAVLRIASCVMFDTYVAPAFSHPPWREPVGGAASHGSRRFTTGKIDTREGDHAGCDREDRFAAGAIKVDASMSPLSAIAWIPRKAGDHARTAFERRPERRSIAYDRLGGWDRAVDFEQPSAVREDAIFDASPADAIAPDEMRHGRAMRHVLEYGIERLVLILEDVEISRGEVEVFLDPSKTLRPEAIAIETEVFFDESLAAFGMVAIDAIAEMPPEKAWRRERQSATAHGLFIGSAAAHAVGERGEEEGIDVELIGRVEDL